MYLWAAPIQAIVTTVLLYLQLGWPVFIGILFLLCMTPLQKRIFGLQKKYALAASKASDQRIKLITEVIHGIQVVKLQAWEKIFSERIRQTRIEELKHRRNIAFVQAFNSALTQSAPIMCTIVTFVVYGAFVATDENPLTAAKAFTTLSFFNILRMPLMVIPMLIGMVAGGTVAAKRLADFLYSDDQVNYVRYASSPGANEDTACVEVQNCEFEWDSAESPEANGGDGKDGQDSAKSDDSSKNAVPFKLRIPTLTLKSGSLTVVAGKVGSGKSSLLAALLGEMTLTTESKSKNAAVVFRGSVAYCSQEPWIQNATLRENVMFGSPFDESRYKEVIEACSLKADIEALPGGDQTEIGERGINLSGGQKARVSLARACYANRDIIVLDDILSAVDAHVARTITDKCLVQMLRNQGKTVLIATHQTLCFPNADAIVILKDGEIAYNGSFADGKNNADFNAILGNNDSMDITEVPENVPGDEERIARKSSVSDIALVEKRASEKTLSEKGKLTKKEVTKEGAVTCSVYTSYAMMVGVPMTILIFMLVLAQNGSQVIVNWWLSRWSVAASIGAVHSVDYYLRIYAILGIGACLLILLFQLSTAIGGLGAAAGIHERMIDSIIKAPMSFFDTTPSGQILNRFTADMKAIDEQLISQLSGALSLLFMMVSVLATMIVILPWIIVVLIPLFLFYGWIQLVYRNTARELKRYDSKTQSPVFNYFSETVNGLSTIRAFKSEARLMSETEKRINYNSRFWTKSNFVNRWLGLRLDWIGAFLVGFTAISCVLAVSFGWPIDPGLVGLVLSYTATLTGLLNWGVRRFSEAEMGMVAVERTKSLAACPQEFTRDAIKDIDASWPKAGEILLKNVSAQYRDGLPKVLKSINLNIGAGTKVGVCGRTGSGKSTLAKCIFRLMEIQQDGGSIKIDNLDISKVELEVLRRNITMIPQDPTLFAGPLRYSLDPGKLYTDKQIWDALELVDCKKHVEEMGKGLDSEIVEGGENLSAGQRQLLCMARALLERPKVLIMDEATSNIDGNTDNKIQEMLKTQFDDCTVLTIAHRIDTIMWYDKVLVLDHGKVREYDDPKVLASQAGSEFGALLQEYRKGREIGN